jgi:hypothetical protein
MDLETCSRDPLETVNAIPGITTKDKELLKNILLSNRPVKGGRKRKNSKNKTLKMKKGGAWCDDSNKCLLVLTLVLMVATGCIVAVSYTYGPAIAASVNELWISLSTTSAGASMLEPIVPGMMPTAAPAAAPSFLPLPTSIPPPDMRIIRAAHHAVDPRAAGMFGEMMLGGDAKAIIQKIMNLINRIHKAGGDGCKKILNPASYPALYRALEVLCKEEIIAPVPGPPLPPVAPAVPRPPVAPAVPRHPVAVVPASDASTKNMGIFISKILKAMSN